MCEEQQEQQHREECMIAHRVYGADREDINRKDDQDY